ncbi:MAG: S41 family peptidase [Magnetospirillum gryphiswaldense]|uniref:S41 family peptidase n=1 Tax=Magnetospirillum sp. 64-120 TaxID=1895778 RepID=UPI0009293E17|nr:S41 family peptidase [Magnetospirillum sp. 64-120]MBI2239197.1 S41 family peptidase [Magnetospirillum gryphiswaldense]OJX77384.1 MAG: peptidase S41 [Magnetospirillum sp. 64-120]
MIRKTMIAASATALLASSFLTPAFAAESKETYRLMELFATVFEKVRAEYVEPVKDEDLVEAALNGMLSSLDPHSSYLNAKNAKDMDINTKGEFGGLGIEVTMENGWVKVVSPIDDTPAFRAGLQPGDFITHLDGEPVQGLSLSEAVDRMRGMVNTDIKLTVRRNGSAPFDVKLTRAVIKIQTVRSHAEGKIGYVRITQFSATTDTDLRKHVEALKKDIGKDLGGFVVDLRNNPGGLLDQAIAVSDDFLDKGEIVSTRSRRPEDTQRYNAKPGDITGGLPVVLLVNDGSASASEIVAGALQDHRRAVVLGTRSFGKGSVQTLMPLGQYGSMRLTTARYYTPSGRSIQAVGIEPDIKVLQSKVEPINVPERERRSEASLRNALANPDGKAAKPATPAAEDAAPAHEDKPAEGAPPVIKMGDPAQDYQLARALDLIRGLSIYRSNGAN